MIDRSKCNETEKEADERVGLTLIGGQHKG